jgi:dTDP-glucose pyrophosphorylase
METLRLSGRGELEITDVNNYYINQGRMGYKVLDRCLPRCWDVWELVEDQGYVQERGYITSDTE